MRDAFVLVAITVIVGASVPSTAEAALGSEQGKCQRGTAAAAMKYFKSSAAALASCHDGIAKGSIGAATDCRVEATASGKLAKAASKLDAKVLKSCSDTSVASLRFDGDCKDVGSSAALAACLIADHDALVDGLLDAAYATSAELGADARKCQAGASKQSRGMATAALKALRQCKNRVAKEKLPTGTLCTDDDATIAKLDKKRTGAAGKIVASCESAAPPFGAPCELVPDAAALAACLVSEADSAGEAGSLTAYGDGSFCGDSHQAVEGRIDDLIAQMTLEEKVAQMTGGGSPVAGTWRTAELPALDIPGFRMIDGPRGVSGLAGAGNATAFPVGIARGASWDPSLEERIGEAIGIEARGVGASVILAPVTTVIRHPRWGRCQETYGEDPLHIGRMGVGFVRGAQRHVIASAKHYALNSIEDTRFTVDVSVDERTMREIYLPHFDMVVNDGDAASIMSAYNLVNGLYCAENSPLLDILKDEFDFRGFVESDWILGTRSTVASALAGLDIEMPSPIFYGPALVTAVNNSDVPVAAIDEAVRRILRTQLCFRLDTDPPVVDPSQLETPEHVALALEAAHESIVLLRNEGGALPLDRGSLSTIAVTGPLADAENIGDTGSSNVMPSAIVTVLEGMQNRAGGVTIEHVADPTSVPGQAAIAAADAVVMVTGFTAADEGESLIGAGDRDTYPLPSDREQLIIDVAALNARTIVVLEGGSAIGVEAWFADVEALLMAWYPGMEGGNAVADIVFGDVNPSGKMPLVVARLESDLPPFVNDQDDVTYDYYHGYRLLDRDGAAPRYPFGFGLSYTTYAYSNLSVADPTLTADETLRVSFDVTNTGAVAGREAAQLYVSYVGSSVDRPMIDLKGFEKLDLAPGQTRTVSLEVAVADLAYYDTGTSGWEVEIITYGVHAGPSSRELPLAGSFDVVP